jgi:hypothetical protein
MADNLTIMPIYDTMKADWKSLYLGGTMKRKGYYEFTVNTPAFTEQELVELNGLKRLRVRQKFVVQAIQDALKKFREANYRT